MSEIMLISNTFDHEKGLLGHCFENILDFLGEIKDVVFIPYAAHSSNWDKYTQTIADKFKQADIMVTGLHTKGHATEQIEFLFNRTLAIFIGGGNSFRLLYYLQLFGLVRAIGRSVRENGMKYIGASAGANMACPKLRLTNDKPIKDIQDFETLHIVPFMINPHYLSDDMYPKGYMGETRDSQIAEYFEENDWSVVALREGAWLTIIDGQVTLRGNISTVFAKNSGNYTMEPGDTFNLIR